MPYIGNIPVPQATQTRDRFTATSGQTTFATSGYTPNFLDVYLNGVHLDASDYTATNGSDVVLATGAATDDIVEVVAFTTFTPANIDAVSAANGGTFSGAVTFTDAFTSRGIDDNATSTAMTLDSSGNLLVGTTNTNPAFSNVAGTVVRNDGLIIASRTNNALDINRKDSDGSIINLRKDGSTVGSIGSSSTGSKLYMAGASSAGMYFQAANIIPTNASGTPTDATYDWGGSGYRWKDLFLSGGVYLGGTGAANYLDDYEEGTWTATSRFGTVTGNDPKNSYIKVGQKVTVWGQVSNFSDTSTNDGIQIGGLPFTVNSTYNSFVVGSCMVSGSSSDDPHACYMQSDSRFAFYQGGTGANILKHTEIGGGGINIWFIVTYYTSA